MVHARHPVEEARLLKKRKNSRRRGPEKNLEGFQHGGREQEHAEDQQYIQLIMVF